MSLKTLLNICKHQFHTCVFSRHLFAGILCNRAIKTLQQTGKLCDCWALEGGRVDECRQLPNACVPHTRLIYMYIHQNLIEEPQVHSQSPFNFPQPCLRPKPLYDLCEFKSRDPPQQQSINLEGSSLSNQPHKETSNRIG